MRAGVGISDEWPFECCWGWIVPEKGELAMVAAGGRGRVDGQHLPLAAPSSPRVSR